MRDLNGIPLTTDYGAVSKSSPSHHVVCCENFSTTISRQVAREECGRAGKHTEKKSAAFNCALTRALGVSMVTASNNSSRA